MNPERCPTCHQLLPSARAPLTEQQTAIMRFLRTFVETKGFAPTLEEIGDSFGYGSSSTVHGHLRALEQKGYIRRVVNANRGISLVDG